MQLQLPLFPSGTKLISPCVGVYEQDGLLFNISLMVCRFMRMARTIYRPSGSLSAI